MASCILDPGKSSPTTFTCPQQPEMSIPMSRVNDGICDCCDGAEESTMEFCNDDCAEILAQQAARRIELQTMFTTGSTEREKMLKEYEQFTIQTKKDMEQVTEDLETKRQQLDESSAELETIETEYVLAHIRRVETAMNNDTLLKGLTIEELQWVIIHACQMAGEMESADDGKTCVPLRLAALQTGSAWETGTYAFRYHQNLSTFADLLYHNGQDNENLFWNPEKFKHSQGGSRRGRRLTRDVAAEEEHDDYIPEEDDYDEDEDEEHRYEERHSDREKYYNNNAHGNTGDSDAPKDREKRQELMDLIQKQRFSKSRVAMVNKASVLLEIIEKLMKENEEEANNEVEEGEPETEKSEGDDETISSEVDKDAKKEEEEETETMNVDPLALPMVKSQLEKRKKTIQRGLDYAVSAKVLLDAVKETMAGDDALDGLLQRLALGTLNHGKLSVIQFYEILAAVVPGLENDIADSQTCRPRSEICPPRAIERSFRVPPMSVSERMEVFCAQALTAEPPPPGVCVVAPSSESSTMDEIPSHVSDGYFGYYVITPRGDDDLFHHLFQGMGFSANGNEELEKIEAKYLDLKESHNNLDNEVDSLKKKLDKLENSLADPEKYGPDGELHAISDECFEVEEGKYVYEVCMFQNAYQRDKGSSSSQGTDLGRWQGASTETVSNEQGVEYPRRVWKWDNGTKCWNGPVRSVTAYVDCGPETKVLSANEPDTCRYVLEMQSPVACDDDFQNRHGLS